MILKKFSEAKAPINGPCYRRKISPGSKLKQEDNSYHFTVIHAPAEEDPDIRCN
jgi:hypothetical protein